MLSKTHDYIIVGITQIFYSYLGIVLGNRGQGGSH